MVLNIKQYRHCVEGLRSVLARLSKRKARSVFIRLSKRTERNAIKSRGIAPTPASIGANEVKELSRIKKRLCFAALFPNIPLDKKDFNL